MVLRPNIILEHKNIMIFYSKFNIFTVKHRAPYHSFFLSIYQTFFIKLYNMLYHKENAFIRKILFYPQHVFLTFYIEKF